MSGDVKAARDWSRERLRALGWTETAPQTVDAVLLTVSELVTNAHVHAHSNAQLVLTWNFIGRSQDDITQAREDWMSGSRFGEVKGYDGARLDAPELPPVPLKPRGRVR
ncbi:hypothetical protein ACIPH4_39260 [Streptomyces tendae]|uniref:hypothetical protein n=1 Tax=Streptomyces tendae TaxID=1932 RepID=UPI003819E1FE